MSEAVSPRPSVPLGRRIRRFMSDQPLVPLIILLIALVAILQIIRPGIVNERWIANTIKFAIPLAILAGCQTMTMLTGGIDLSVGTVATMSAFIMATQVVNHDPSVAILIALVPAVLVGAVFFVVLYPLEAVFPSCDDAPAEIPDAQPAPEVRGSEAAPGS